MNPENYGDRSHGFFYWDHCKGFQFYSKWDRKQNILESGVTRLSYFVLTCILARLLCLICWKSPEGGQGDQLEDKRSGERWWWLRTLFAVKVLRSTGSVSSGFAGGQDESQEQNWRIKRRSGLQTWGIQGWCCSYYYHQHIVWNLDTSALHQYLLSGFEFNWPPVLLFSVPSFLHRRGAAWLFREKNALKLCLQTIALS